MCVDSNVTQYEIIRDGKILEMEDRINRVRMDNKEIREEIFLFFFSSRRGRSMCEKSRARRVVTATGTRGWTR